MALAPTVQAGSTSTDLRPDLASLNNGSHGGQSDERYGARKTDLLEIAPGSANTEKYALTNRHFVGAFSSA